MFWTSLWVNLSFRRVTTVGLLCWCTRVFICAVFVPVDTSYTIGKYSAGGFQWKCRPVHAERAPVFDYDDVDGALFIPSVLSHRMLSCVHSDGLRCVASPSTCGAAPHGTGTQRILNPWCERTLSACRSVNERYTESWGMLLHTNTDEHAFCDINTALATGYQPTCVSECHERCYF